MIIATAASPSITAGARISPPDVGKISPPDPRWGRGAGDLVRPPRPKPEEGREEEKKRGGGAVYWKQQQQQCHTLMAAHRE